MPGMDGRRISAMAVDSGEILDLSAAVSINFVLTDGIVAMNGNDPPSGTPRPLGKIVPANEGIDLNSSFEVTADSSTSCSRLTR